MTRSRLLLVQSTAVLLLGIYALMTPAPAAAAATDQCIICAATHECPEQSLQDQACDQLCGAGSHSVAGSCEEGVNCDFQFYPMGWECTF